ncbi:MAG: hypothetical protein EBZ47_09085 [Chlamydiae bacterium]|nr:hypothetical protein [Chlamydiota bacterium]
MTLLYAQNNLITKYKKYLLLTSYPLRLFFRGGLICFCFLLISYSLEAKEKPVAPSQLESAFKQAYLLEKNQLNNQARKQYIKLADQTIKQFDLLNNEEKPLYLPVLFASAVRAGLLTAKVGYGIVCPLYMQVDQLKEAEDTLDRVLLIAIDLLNHPSQKIISRRQVAELYVARAYVRIASTSKMIDGIYWKNAIIYPFPGILSVFNAGIADLNYLFNTYLDSEKSNLNQAQVEAFLKEELSIKASYKFFSLCYDQGDIPTLSKLISKQDTFLYTFYQYTLSSEFQKSIENAKLYVSAEDFLNHVLIYSTFQQINHLLDIK